MRAQICGQQYDLYHYQAIVKNTLEPFWQARFERISYGFRPGRSCHDAIAKIYLLARPSGRKKWLVDADIQAAFDNLDQGALLKALGDFPLRQHIRQWLEAGYLETGRLHPTGSAGNNVSLLDSVADDRRPAACIYLTIGSARGYYRLSLWRRIAFGSSSTVVSFSRKVALMRRISERAAAMPVAVSGGEKDTPP
jgi:Reverse transcriptase (RNA-dependent DNA polymerase)